MPYDDSDYYDDMQSEYEAKLIEDGIRELSRDAVRAYLGRNGDAVMERVDECMADGDALIAEDRFGLALVRASIASELVVHYLVVQPLVQGAFLSDEWAAVLTRRITRGGRIGDRELLPTVVAEWGIDLHALRLPDGPPLWETLVTSVWPVRDGFLHRADAVSEPAATVAMQAARALLDQLVVRISEEFRLSWPHNAWADVTQGVGTAELSTTFSRESPFP